MVSAAPLMNEIVSVAELKHGPMSGERKLKSIKSLTKSETGVSGQIDGQMGHAELSSADFPDFFAALWGHPPFAWQQALADRVLANAEAPWPEAIALPTASGKTACLDIAIFALAVQAVRLNRHQAITAPRRIFFVVDRRVIVDEAHERACRMAKKLANAEDGILKTVADNLRRIARGGMIGPANELPLAAHVLRGGMYRSEAWARHPLQPAVVASTVDQVGSRLLFRAYGRGPRTWPIYAGLIANDSLILLDEAHCAQPFLQTLQAVRRFRTWALAPLDRPFHPVVMSATPPPGTADVFEDPSGEGRDPDHPLGRRQLARKPAVLQTVERARGKRASVELAKALAEAASGLINDDRRAVVVFVNRVATARETHRLLAADYRDRALLLTGRMRPVDKEIVQQRLRPLGSALASERSLEAPWIVVATQTLEVGADLDFDGLVTECASLDALRQRFGRLNRMGRPIEARAVLLVRGDQADSGKAQDDPVYGTALTNTWKWLNELKNEDDEVDFGIAHIAESLSQGDSLDQLNAPSVDAPVMLPAHVDCWAQTAPEPAPSPDVALFLRGPREGAPDVQVCWRADIVLQNEETRACALESLSLCPPCSSETLPVPISVFRRWLAGEDAEDDSSDVEGSATAGDRDEESVLHPGGEVIRWKGSETRQENITADPEHIRPGDVIVVPAKHPLPRHPLGDLPQDLDVGDRACRLARARPILRIHRDLVDAWPDTGTASEDACELLKDLSRRCEDDPDGITDDLRQLLTELSDSPEPTWLSTVARELCAESRLDHAYHVVGNSIVLVGRRTIPSLTHGADSFSDEDEMATSGTAHGNGAPVRLATHLSGVEALARCHASACGLPEDLVETIACAGRLHDLGKTDPRLQSLLRGGAPWLDGELLAKSAGVPRTRAARARARKDSGYPEGGRHELLSTRLAESAPALLPDQEDLRDLTLHLVASHHGHCRPFAPVVSDERGVDVDFEWRGHRTQWSGATGLERLDSGVSDRYWKLVRRYGWWGLAWLEALLRLADWRQSDLEEETDDGQ